MQWAKVTTEDFDPKTLAQSLRHTNAIGFFTKLQLKDDIDTLVEELRQLDRGKGDATLHQLYERFQLLVHKIVSLLQDKDPNLARRITDARQNMWKWLSDPNKSGKL